MPALAKSVIANLTYPLRVLATLFSPSFQGYRTRNDDWQFRSLVEEAAIGVALESLEGDIFYVNPAFCRMLGYTGKELRGMRCSEFSHPEDERTEMALFGQLREGLRSAYQVDKRFRHKSNEWIWARVSISLLKAKAQDLPLIVGVVEDIKERRLAEEEVKRTKLVLEQLTGRLLRAQEEERRRISQELHDDIGQRMVLMSMEIEQLEQKLRGAGDDIFAQSAANLNVHLEEVASAIHDMCRALHSSKLDNMGLRAALNELCVSICQHSGIFVRLEMNEDTDGLPEEVARCLYRVAQEALNNVSKHSMAQSAQVLATKEGDDVRLTIRDFGVGFDCSDLQNSTGIGLASMRERLRSVGGTLVIRSSRGHGTEVTAEMKCVTRVTAAAGS